MMTPVGKPQPVRLIKAAAPIRICDIGGWTDTWFAGHGCVFNIGVRPGVEVEVKVHRRDSLPDRIVLDAENFEERYAFGPGRLPGRHPLLEAAVDDIGLPDDASVEIRVRSGAPAGSSTGTSASVTVALVAALDALTPGSLTVDELASTAHRIEVERLGAESGIQDQLCAAYGGINFIDVPAFPRASVLPLSLPGAVWQELERRLVLVYLGRAHVSSEVHEQVIAALAGQGQSSPHLETLRRAAGDAREACLAGDFPRLGRTMVQNTEAQGHLDADLIGRAARHAIDVAAAHGALGWKVNGAGGDGGSLTLLCGPKVGEHRRLVRALRDADPQFEIIPISLSRRGVSVWDG